MKNIIGFVRTSTMKQGNSIKLQRDKIKEYVKDRNLQLVDIIEEEGVSGDKLNRAGYDTIMDMVKNNRVDGVVCYDFPTPRALTRASKSNLRRMQFSDAKVRTIVDLSWAFTNGSMHGIETLSTFEAIKRLTEIKGIGSWTAETGLLRGLGRLDAFPADDLAIRKLISE